VRIANTLAADVCFVDRYEGTIRVLWNASSSGGMGAAGQGDAFTASAFFSRSS